MTLPTRASVVALATNLDATPEQLREGLSLAVLTSADGMGQLPIHTACVHGNVAFLRCAWGLVCGSPALFEVQDNNLRSPLHLAAWNDKGEAVAFLVETVGVVLNPREKGGYTPLFFAVYRQHTEIAGRLLDAGASLGIPSLARESGVLPLHQACIAGSVAMVHLLLGGEDGGDEEGTAERRRFLRQNVEQANQQQRLGPVARDNWAADVAAGPHAATLFVDQPDANGNAPLHVAVQNNRPRCVAALLLHGASTEARNKHGDTPLFLACKKGSAGQADAVELVRPLLAATPDHVVLEHHPKTKLSLDDLVETGQATPLGALVLPRLAELRQRLPVPLAPGDSADDDEDALCLICHNVMLKPTRLACGHAFCLWCISASLTEDGLCPFRCGQRHAGLLLVDTELEAAIAARHPDAVSRRAQLALRQRANLLLQRYAASRPGGGPALLFNEHDTCDVPFPAGHVTKITLLRDELYVYTQILKELPADDGQRLAVLELLAEGACMGTHVAGGGAGVLTSGSVIVTHSVQLAVCKPTALGEVMTVHQRNLTGWFERVRSVTAEGGDLAAARRVAVVSESPAPSLLAHRPGDAQKAKRTVELLRDGLPEAERASLRFDGVRTWYAKTSRVSLTLTYEARSDVLFAYSPVWNGLPRRPEVRARMFGDLLATNLFFSELPGGGCGIDASGDFVLVHMGIQLGCNDVGVLAAVYHRFLAQVDRCVQLCNAAANHLSAMPVGHADRRTLPFRRAVLAAFASVWSGHRLLGALFPPAVAAHWRPALAAVVDQWCSAARTPRVRLAVLVWTRPDHLPAVTFAQRALTALGHHCLVVGGEAATLRGLLLALHVAFVLATTRNLASFHFCAVGERVHVADGRGGRHPCLLLGGRGGDVDGGNGTGTALFPLALVRHVAEAVVRFGAASCAQVVLDLEQQEQEQEQQQEQDGAGLLGLFLPALPPAVVQAVPWLADVCFLPRAQLWRDLPAGVVCVEAVGGSSGRPGWLARCLFGALLQTGIGAEACVRRALWPASHPAAPFAPGVDAFAAGLAAVAADVPSESRPVCHNSGAVRRARQQQQQQQQPRGDEVAGDVLTVQALKANLAAVLHLARLRAAVVERRPRARFAVWCAPEALLCRFNTDEPPVVDCLVWNRWALEKSDADTSTGQILGGLLHGLRPGRTLAVVDPSLRRGVGSATVLRVGDASAFVELRLTRPGVTVRDGLVLVDDPRADRAALLPVCVHREGGSGGEGRPDHHHLPPSSPSSPSSSLRVRDLAWASSPVCPVRIVPFAAQALVCLGPCDDGLSPPWLWSGGPAAEEDGQREDAGAAEEEEEGEAEVRRRVPAMAALDTEGLATRAIARRVLPITEHDPALAEATRALGECGGPLRDVLVDPLTQRVRCRFVFLADGSLLEEAVALLWLRVHRVAPLGGQPLAHTTPTVARDLELLRDRLLGPRHAAAVARLAVRLHEATSPHPASASAASSASSQGAAATTIITTIPPVTDPDGNRWRRGEPSLAERLRWVELAMGIEGPRLWRLRRFLAQLLPDADVDATTTTTAAAVPHLPGAELGDPLRVWRGELDATWFVAEGTGIALVGSPALYSADAWVECYTAAASELVTGTASAPPLDRALLSLCAAQRLSARWHGDDGNGDGNGSLVAFVRQHWPDNGDLGGDDGDLVLLRLLLVVAHHRGAAAATEEEEGTEEGPEEKGPERRAAAVLRRFLLAHRRGLDTGLDTEGGADDDDNDVPGTEAEADAPEEAPLCLRIRREALWPATVPTTASSSSFVVPSAGRPAWLRARGLLPGLRNDKAESLLARIAAFVGHLWHFNHGLVAPPAAPPSPSSPLHGVRVRVTHERGEVTLRSWSLGSDRPALFIGDDAEDEDVLAGDVVRMRPFLEGQADEHASLTAFLYLYDFLPSFTATMLDRSPIVLRTPGQCTFPGTGGVVEWEADEYVQWDDGARFNGHAIEHFKLFLTDRDTNPLQLSKHRFEDAPRDADTAVAWVAFTVSFRLAPPA